jgi:hypothetical protein
MSKFAHSDVLDAPWLAIQSGGVRLHLLRTYTPGDSFATVASNTIGYATMASGDYTLANGSNSSRTLTTAAGKTGTASAGSTQYDTGTATAGTTTTLTDSSKSWTVNAHAGRALTIVSGTGAGQASVIASNTSTALTVSPAFTTAPDATSVYRISDNLHFAITDNSAKVLAVTDENTNQAIISGNTVTFPSIVFTNPQPV